MKKRSREAVREQQVLEFMELVWAVAHGLQAKSKKMLKQLGVTGPQRLVIVALRKNPGMTAGAMARALHLHPSTLTGIVTRLEEAGLIARAPDRLDLRRTLHFLTPAGRRASRQDPRTVEDAVRRTLSSLPADEIEAFERGLARFAEELKDT